MAQEKQETRDEEVARVRSYLASQAMRRSPEQIVEALREATQQFLTATAAVSNAVFHTVPKEGEWSAADVLAHVRHIATLEERSICGVIEHGKQPANIDDVIKQAPMNATRLVYHGQAYQVPLPDGGAKHSLRAFHHARTCPCI